MSFSEIRTSSGVERSPEKPLPGDIPEYNYRIHSAWMKMIVFYPKAYRQANRDILDGKNTNQIRYTDTGIAE